MTAASSKPLAISRDVRTAYKWLEIPALLEAVSFNTSRAIARWQDEASRASTSGKPAVIDRKLVTTLLPESNSEAVFSARMSVLAHLRIRLDSCV